MDLEDKRLNMSKLKMQESLFIKNELLKAGFDSVDSMIAVVNRERQTIFANKTFLSAAGYERMEEIFGKRPGNIIRCIHSEDCSLGCGFSAACSDCEAQRVMIECINKKEKNSGEVALSIKTEIGETTMNFRVLAELFEIENNEFYTIVFNEIGDTVKKRWLERMFFHDILNIAGGLGGYIKLIKNNSSSKMGEDIEFIDEAVQCLLDEIYSHKQILDAENKHIILEKKCIQSLDIIQSVKKFCEKGNISLGKKITIHENSENITLISDDTLLKRVLINMMKNALESTSKGKTVTIGCKTIIENSEKYVKLWVNNTEYIDEHLKYKIFKRSFSTKGEGRGIGTYSMKMLGEEYLGGKVDFTTDMKNGTTFYIKLPIKN